MAHKRAARRHSVAKTHLPRSRRNASGVGSFFLDCRNPVALFDYAMNTLLNSIGVEHAKLNSLVAHNTSIRAGRCAIYRAGNTGTGRNPIRTVAVSAEEFREVCQIIQLT